MTNNLIPSKIKQDSNSIENNQSFIRVLVTTFITVFIAELGDKTQLATLLLSANSGKPFLVFLGSSMALILCSLIGVLVGQFLSNIIKPETFEYFAGAIMTGIGIWLSIEVILPHIQVIS